MTYATRPTLTTLLSLVMALAVVGAAGVFAGEKWTDERLPLADPEKPLYQKSGWWKLSIERKVRILDTRTIEQIRQDMEVEFDEKINAINLKEYNRGSWMITVGLLVVSVAVAAHLMTSVPKIQRIATGIGFLGVGISAAGFVQKKTLEFNHHIWWAGVILLSLFIVYKMRNWSITHLFNRSTTKTH